VPLGNFPPGLHKRGDQMNIQLFVEDAPFSNEKNHLKKSAKDWTINELWIYNL
jgi:hypothetical protein